MRAAHALAGGPTPSATDAGSPAWRVAIAHDWLVSYGGAERCLDEMLAVFPDADLYTSVVDRRELPPSLQRARASFLQRIPGSPHHHELLLPLMPAAWQLRRALSDVDLVISSSYACAKAVRIQAHVPHVCYCHTPMRYAWNFASEAGRFPKGSHHVVRALMGAFRAWDVSTARRVTEFAANSTAVAQRINQFYGREARVIHPPVRTDFFTHIGGDRDEFYLYVGRLTGYKRPDLVVEAFADLPYRLVVVGDGPMAPQLSRMATPNVHFAGRVDDEELRTLYRTTRALVYPVEEDFGIGMAEAQACGAPVVGFYRGGAADIVSHDGLGVLVESQNVMAVKRAIEEIERRRFDYAAIAVEGARFNAARFRQALSEVVSETLARSRVHLPHRDGVSRRGAARPA